MSAITALSKPSFAANVAVPSSVVATTRRAAVAAVDSLGAATKRSVTASSLPPPSAPSTTLTPALSAGAASFANNLDAVDAFGGSADSLTAAFLKLNIADPNESVQVHDELYEAASNLRQLGIDAAKKANENARELQKELEKLAGFAAMVGNIAAVAQLAAAVASIATGPGALIATASVFRVVEAGATYAATSKELQIKQVELEATRNNARADEGQQRLSEEGDIINTIMEQKNHTVDVVLQMINASGDAKRNLLMSSFAA